MFRNFSLRAPLAAIAFGALALGASLSPTAALAGHGGHGGHGGWGHHGGHGGWGGHGGFGHRGWGFRRFGYVSYGDCYLRRAVNDFGEVILVRRCY